MVVMGGRRRRIAYMKKNAVNKALENDTQTV